MHSVEAFIKGKFDEQFQNYQKICIGYVEPGHGWKGKQVWLNDEEDLDTLYSIYAGVPQNILLWCYPPMKDPKKKDI